MKQLEHYQVPQQPIKQSQIYAALEALTHYNDTYKKAYYGAWLRNLPRGSGALFVEDVGRHNAVDTLVGEMWLNGMRGDDKIFTPQVV